MQTGSVDILPPENGPFYNPPVSGVLSSRLIAYFVDFLVICVLVFFYYMLAGFLGFFTFGFTWIFLPIMVPLVALFYNGLTLSGPNRATWGMRLVGIEMRMRDGLQVGFVVAAVHAVQNDHTSTRRVTILSHGTKPVPLFAATHRTKSFCPSRRHACGRI